MVASSNNNYSPLTPEEKEYLESYKPHEYPSIGYSTDLVILTIIRGELSVLLIRRGNHPYKDHWALPGGFVNEYESGEEAARRELIEETGVNIDKAHLEQLKTYSDPRRDPRMRVISTAYIALLPNIEEPTAGDDASEARFFPVKDIFSQWVEDKVKLAFDHETILKDGLERAANKLEYSPVATAFLPETFTIADLRRVYETVWGYELHAPNFRRKVLSTPDFITPMNTTGDPQFSEGRRASLYTRGTATLLHPPILRNKDERE